MQLAQHIDRQRRTGDWPLEVIVGRPEWLAMGRPTRINGVWVRPGAVPVVGTDARVPL